MKKILFISGYFNVAGTETFMLNVVRASDKSKFHYDFLIFNQANNKYKDEAERLGCKFYTLIPRSKFPIKYLKELYVFFNTHAKEYEAIHWCGGDISSIAPIFFAWVFDIPVRIIHAHNSSCTGLHTKILHYMNRLLLPLVSNKFFSCSTLASKFFFGNKHSIIIKNGIDLSKFRYNENIRKEVRRELNLNHSDILIGHVGRFDQVKNQTFLVDILSSLSKIDIHYKLLLVGEGDTYNAIKEKVSNLQLDDKVIMIGNRTDVNRLYQAMDIFIMPSFYEGLPFVLVEAQAAGLPCLISENINDDAVLTPNTIKKDINCGIESWCNDTKALSQIKRTDLSDYVANKGFSIKNTIEYLEKIYSQKDPN